MPNVARGNGKDTVHSLTGTGENCTGGSIDTVTGTCSINVIVNDYGIVRKTDIVGEHQGQNCNTDISQLSTYSPNVFANDLEIGRKDDQYSSDNTITSGSPDVFAN